MLQTQRPSIQPDYGPPIAENEGLNLEQLIAAARRRAWLVAVFVLLGVLLGAAYLLTAVPLYTSSTQLLIDTRESRSAQEASVMPDMVFDEAMVESQVEVLRSEKIAEAVVDRLKLLDNGVFNSRHGNLFSIATDNLALLAGKLSDEMSLASGPGEQLIPQEERDAALRRAAVAKLRANLQVGRVNRTHVLDISYTSADSGLSGQIANAYAEAYINDKLDAAYEATRRAGVWLQERIADTEQQANAADIAVQQFRQEHDLMSASGELLSDQQLTGVNGQLIAARAEAGEAEARYSRIRDIIDNRETDAAVSEALASGIISDLRSRYLDASKRYQDIAGRLGPNHAQARKLSGEMHQYERLIFEELKRIAQVYRSNLEVAKNRVAALEEEVRRLAGTTAAATETQTELRERQRQASTYRNLHDTLVARYEETVQRNTFPISEARILSSAAPGDKTHPRASLVLTLAAFAGAAVGGGLGALAEFRDRVFRTGDQVRDELGLEFIGALNVLPSGRAPRQDRRAEPSATAARTARVDARDPVLRQSIDAPLSAFAETLRTTKVACDLVIGNKSPKIVGIVSILPNEGKTTVAKNLASLVASSGAKVLLIDGDLRNPGLTRGAVTGASEGLIDVLRGNRPWRDVLVTEEDSGLQLIPTLPSRSISHTGDLVSSPRMRALLSEAGGHYEYVFVDLPPLGAVVDARAAAHLLDALVFVVEWGKTDRKLVKAALENDPRLHEMCVGILFNKVDVAKMKLYSGYHHFGYYDKAYARYYSS
ncbi:Wzz/FepE/Etk N-terminal domain-containing protein [Jiella pacifica]|uniref:non-specific protein-tyrosine kinase n=1 Tax=Jiella pacifica TaxID=2696469 RepID=A0A6N9SZ37_9HYPH|nr:Wzz/FepE/Etk N-terminal domain-containing protein [Jiella pacifica]NDW04363.1 AAA family ATPase [Jiella pacifica]